ncbi:MAG: septal ring lytic transglycosylase RlpA family protein [Bryobacterales bacterium]|nr:septal ring lytic transglycosylase RlpA family protein [Bryobacterales bacterium]
MHRRPVKILTAKIEKYENTRSGKIVLLNEVRCGLYPCGFRASRGLRSRRWEIFQRIAGLCIASPRVLLLLLCAVLLFSLASCSHRRAPRAITPKIGTREKGIASWYGHPYHGRATASGEIYNMEHATAAHRRYAFGTWVRVDNLDNGKRAEVRINDRGPFVKGRIIDLSRASARQIDMLRPGTARVRLTVIAPPARSGGAAAFAAVVEQQERAAVSAQDAQSASMCASADASPSIAVAVQE